MSWERVRQVDNSSNSLYFINNNSGAKCKMYFGQEVKNLSLVKPEELANIEYFLGKKFKIVNDHLRLFFVAKDRKNNPVEINEKINSLSMRYVFHSLLNNEEFVDFDGLIFELQIEAQINGGEFCANSYIFYSDLPTYQDAYVLVRKIEEMIKILVPNVFFINNLGLCGKCKKTISLNDHLRDQYFLCHECYEFEILKEKSKEKAKADIKKYIYKVLLPENELIVNKKLREIIYQEYDGKCQYCFESEKLPQEKTVIDHIIPRSISLDSVSQLLTTNGVSEHHIIDFCKSMLPPIHDCLLNYTLSCIRHNSKKGNRILHPIAIELLLNQSRIKSKRIIDRINNS